MSPSASYTQNWIRPPLSLDSFGKFLLGALDRHAFSGFLCFLQSEESLTIYPEPDLVRQRELASHLLSVNWAEDPRPAFLEVFRRGEIAPGADLEKRLRWRILRTARDAAPLGACVYVLEDPADDPVERSGPLIEACAREAVACGDVIRKFSTLASQSEYLFSTINRVGCMLLRRARRPQVLAAMLDLSIYLTRSEVGAILVRGTDGEFECEIELGLSPEVINDLRLLPERRSIAEHLERTGDALIIDDVSGPTVEIPREHPVRLRSLIATPIFLQEELVGMVCLASGESGRDLSTNELRSLETISAVISLAVENELLQEGRASRGRDASGPGLESLRPLFEALEEGVVVADGRGELIYRNSAADGLIGWVPAGKSRPAGDRLQWLRRHWRDGEEGEAVRMPFPEPRGRVLEVITRSLPARREKDPATISLVAPARDRDHRPDRVQIAALLRRHATVMRLGLDLAAEVEQGEPERLPEISGILSRALGELEALCEDLESRPGDEAGWERKALGLESILLEAVARLGRTTAGELGVIIEDSGGTDMTVLGDPRRLEGAFSRILSEVFQRGAEGRIPEIDLMRVGELACARIEFSLRAPGLEEDFLRFVENRPGTAPEGPWSVRGALATLERHGGHIEFTSLKEERARLSVFLPLAPGCAEEPPEVEVLEIGERGVET